MYIVIVYLELYYLVISICIDVSFRLYLSTHRINWCKKSEQQSKRSKLYANFFEKEKHLAFMCNMMCDIILEFYSFSFCNLVVFADIIVVYSM